MHGRRLTWLVGGIRLIAGICTARAGISPAPGNGVPVGVGSLMWIVPQRIGAASPDTLLEMPGFAAALGSDGFLASPLGLGVLAGVLIRNGRQCSLPAGSGSVDFDEGSVTARSAVGRAPGGGAPCR